MGNDHDLAMEVLAAMRAKRNDELRDYVLDRAIDESPLIRPVP